MNFLLNLIWVIFGGLMVAIEYVIASVMMMVTIVGIPFGMQHFKLMRLALFPFGKSIS